ncbi:deoxyguanosine kinase-like [Dysidea avara]|uniref:deoxyguanosine kinase-like n=1 Tax=Dysidea avara TaxID=196820 RepID=UPI0033257774
MIGDPTIVNAFDCEVTCAEVATRKIPGGREATPPRCDEGNIVLVEGNIGVGKTTLCRELADRLKYKMFCEPATENPYLAKFYSNPKKYALQLQLWIFNQRCHTYVDAMEHVAKTGGGAILDRSVYSDCVFANVGRNEGYINKEGYAVYEKLRNEVLQKLSPPNCVIYLSTTPEICHERVGIRGRDCESGLPLDYLAALHDEYNLFVDEMRNYKDRSCCVMEFDWSKFGSTEKIAQRIQSTCCTNDDWNITKPTTTHSDKIFTLLEQAMDQCQKSLVE